MRAFPFRLLKMKCYLSLKRLKGQRSASVPVEVRKRLVDFRLTRADGYRVARALCCTGGSEVAVLWEPTLIRVGADSFLFQGFEKADQQLWFRNGSSSRTSQETAALIRRVRSCPPDSSHRDYCIDSSISMPPTGRELFHWLR